MDDRIALETLVRALGRRADDPGSAADPERRGELSHQLAPFAAQPCEPSGSFESSASSISASSSAIRSR